MHIFRGKEEPAKEVECVLIYNEEDGVRCYRTLPYTPAHFLADVYSREAGLDVRTASRRPWASEGASSLRVSYVRLFRTHLLCAHVLLAVQTPPAAAPTPVAEEQDDLTAELDRELLTTLIDDEPDVPLAKKSPVRSPEIRKQPAAPPPRTPIAASVAQKPRPKLKGTTSAVTKPPPKTSPTVSRGKGKGKEVAAVDADEEELNFGQPAQPAKRPRLSPRPGLKSSASSFGLALPSANTSALLAPPLPGPPAAQEEDEEDEWDQVAGTSAGAPAATDDASIFGDGFGGASAGTGAEGEDIEIDLNQFAADLDEELNDAFASVDASGAEDDPFGEDAEGEAESELFGAMEGVEEGAKRPISLNQFAGGGGAAEQDDDDYSSSEESDED